MTASSVAPGTTPPVHFVASFQFPLTAEAQEMTRVGAATTPENSEVFPSASVAVAVTRAPEGSGRAVGKARVKSSRPAASVVARTAPRKCSPCGRAAGGPTAPGAAGSTV